MLYTFVIEGNLIADPALRTTNTGVSVCDFRIAYNSRRRNAQGAWEDGRAVWITVTCWRGLAERAARLRKGDTVVVEAADDLRAEAYGQGASLRVTANNVSLSMRWHEAASQRRRTPAESAGDAVHTADGEDFDADIYAEYLAEKEVTTA